MELPPVLPLRPASDPQQLFAELGGTGMHDGAVAAPRQRARHFDDILGQTLAGPLFATWTPTAPVNPASGSAASGSSTTPIDPNARRDGRRRSRR